MAAKSARNGSAVAAPKPPAGAKQPTDRQLPAAQRIAQLEADVATLKKAMDGAGRILASMIENQAVQGAMPAIEQQIRGSIQQAYAQGGLEALVPGGQPQAPQMPPQIPQEA